MKKVIKNVVKFVALFVIGLGIGKLIHKHVCKKYAYEKIADTSELAIR